jgi:uncharacterized membrane protein SpoIIM required for sporulation
MQKYSRMVEQKRRCMAYFVRIQLFVLRLISLTLFTTIDAQNLYMQSVQSIDSAINSQLTRRHYGYTRKRVL